MDINDLYNLTQLHHSERQEWVEEDRASRAAATRGSRNLVAWMALRAVTELGILVMLVVIAGKLA